MPHKDPEKKRAYWEKRLADPRVKSAARARANAWRKARPGHEADRWAAMTEEQRGANRIRQRAASTKHLQTAKGKASHCLASSRRRARKAGMVTTEEWKEQLNVFDHRCAYCLKKNVPLEVEHMIPLSRGGRHDIDNVVPCCAPCNLLKFTGGPLALVNRQVSHS